MLPSKELNIYPKSDENLQSLISFYFDKYDIVNDDGITILKAKSSLSLNQVEFILRKLSEAYVPIFQKNLKGQISISNLIKYGFDAFIESELGRMSRGRELITKEFKDFVSKSDLPF